MMNIKFQIILIHLSYFCGFCMSKYLLDTCRKYIITIVQISGNPNRSQSIGGLRLPCGLVTCSLNIRYSLLILNSTI